MVGIARVARVHDPSFRATRWRVDDLVDVQDALEPAMADVDADPAMLFIPVAAFVHFLRAADHWTGSDDEYADAVTALAELCGELEGTNHFGIPDLPEIEPDVEFAALRALPLVQRVGDLLRWIGEGRPVTSTGALRRKDVREAAGLAGVDVDTVRDIRSMWDVTELALLWNFAIEAQLIAVTRTKAVLLAAAGPFVGSGPTTSDHHGAIQVAVAQFVAMVLIPDEEGWGLYANDAVHTVMHILADALGDEPAPIDCLDAAAEPGIAGAMVRGRARAVLETLRRAGLVAVDEAYTVPAALKQVVHIGLLAATDESPDDDPYPLDLESPDRETYRLRVGLDGSVPQVWRSFEIVADAPLAILHLAIQSSFEWCDDHLHMFHARRARKPLDETRRIDAVLRRVGDAVTYVYDFGDSWHHTVEVEAITTEDDSVVVRFVDGRGMAPQEDSGGVWGWSHKVETANDPTSPDYHDVREWLDLQPGEGIDPTAFDAGVVADRLANVDRAIRGSARSR